MPALVLAMTVRPATAADGDDHFEKHVRPLLLERCHKCHSGKESKGGLRLDSRGALLKGGDSGAAIVVKQSTLVGRPAVRFSPWTGLASSPGNQVDIRGDAALTMTLVMNLTKFAGQPSHSSVFGVGNPAYAGDPGKPLAALLEIDQPQQFSLDFAGGWGHDAVLAPGSYQPLFGKPVIVTIVKRPGPLKATRFFINGKLAGPTDGRDHHPHAFTVPRSVAPAFPKGLMSCLSR